MHSIYEKKLLKDLEEDLKNYDYLDPMKDIVFKSILKKDKNHTIIKILVKGLVGIDLINIKELDSGFTAKGKNRRGEACDYMIQVDGKTISLECNKNYDNKLFSRNISHLRRMIIQEDFEVIQINIDNYDIGGENKYTYCYSLQEESTGKEIYQNLIRIYHINIAKFNKELYNKNENELSLFEKTCLLFITRDKNKLEKLVKGDENLMEVKKVIEDISSNRDLYENYTKRELEYMVEAEIKAKEIAKDMAQDIAQDMAQDKVIETAKKMLEKGSSIEFVSECTGLSIEDIKEL